MIIILECHRYAQKVIVLAVPKELCIFQVNEMWTSTRGSCRSLLERSDQKPNFLVDIIDGWPLTQEEMWRNLKAAYIHTIIHTCNCMHTWLHIYIYMHIHTSIH